MKLKLLLLAVLGMVMYLPSLSATGNPTNPANAKLKPIKKLPLKPLVLKERESGIIEVPLDKTAGTAPGTSTLGQQFFFPELEEELAQLESQMLMPPAGPTQLNSPFSAFMLEIGNGQYSAKAKKAQRIIDQALEFGNIITGLTGGSLVNMPLVMEQDIGQNTITIVFNSAKIYPEYAEIEVYIKIELPQKDFQGNDVVLYFGAKNIFFSQEKGIISGSVGLLADYAFKIGSSDKGGIYLTKMTETLIDDKGTPSPLDDEYEYNGTYINFDCDGFKEMGIGGRVYFSRDWVLPTDEFGNVLQQTNDDLSPTPRVKGEFQLIVQDWNDFLVEGLSIDHFVMTEWQEMSFYLGNANLDLSSYRNPSGIPYPFVPPNIWEGVYIETIAITLPKPFKRTTNSFSTSGAGPNGNYPPPETERIKISAEHLLIDEAGVSGEFTIESQVPLIGGAIMDGEWGWSLDLISIGLIQSDINYFEFSGQLGVPILSKQGPIDYSAEYDKAQDKYAFTAGTNQGNKQIPVWNAAEVTIGDIEITVEIVNEEFDASVTFSMVGLTIGNPNDYANSQTGSTVKMPSVTFFDMTLSTKAPVFDYGSLEIETPDSKLMNFPISINNFSLEVNGGDPAEMVFGFTLDINLMAQSGNQVAASGDLEIVGDYRRDINGTRQWKFRELRFLGAMVEVSLPQFYGKGTLCLYEDDPTYGKGFYASLEAGILGEGVLTSADQGRFQLDMVAIFGNNGGYRYFLVDGFFSGLRVPLYGPFYMDGIGGGVFSFMKPTGHDPNGAGPDIGNCSAPVSTSGLIYEPTKETKLGIKFSTSISTDANLMQGMLTCIVRFDQNMALQNIMFWGTVDVMLPSALSDNLTATLDDFQQKIPNVIKPSSELQADAATEAQSVQDGIKAKLGLSLNFSGGFKLHGFAEVSIAVGDILTGSGSFDLLLDPDAGDWHYYMGGYYENDQGQDILVPNFFNDNEFIRLDPVSVRVNYGGFNVSANAYFLTGTTIPGPPPPAPEVVAFFGPEANQNNRGMLNCGPNSQAMGTGIAFGASAFFDFNKTKKGLFGSCILGYKVSVAGGVGFDISLLKFDPSTSCSINPQTDHGINGFRAGGRVFVFINIESGHVTCLPIPPLGAGVKVRFDVPNPSYFDVTAVLKVGKKFTFNLDIGEECGAPCITN